MRIRDFKPLKAAARFLKTAYNNIKNRMWRKNIRLQLILIFALCFILSIIATSVSGNFIRRLTGHSYIDYSVSVDRMDKGARGIVYGLSQSGLSIKDRVRIEEYINFWSIPYGFKILIADHNGNVIAKTLNASGIKVDVHSIIEMSMDMKTRENAKNGTGEFYNVYPVSFSDISAFAVISGIPQARHVRTVYNGGPLLYLAIGTIFFIILFLAFTKRKMDYLEELNKGLLEISQGNLNFRVPRRSRDELGSLADNINYMAGELNNKIQEERRAENTKNELITNISHDLKTPLTSIMGYLKLIKDKNYRDQEQLGDFVNIAYSKSEKLKSLIDDLFEYTKLTDRGSKLNRKSIRVDELLNQLIEEMIPICEENELIVVKDMPEKKVMADVDADKIVRAFENLLTNAIRYSPKPGEINIKLKDEGNNVTVSFRNKGDGISDEELPLLFERFYRVEKSRSSDTGGSGLGLAIAKGIIELHGGRIWAEYKDGEITFHVTIPKTAS